MSAQPTIRERIKAWFHPAEDALLRMKRLGESMGFAKGFEEAMKQIPARWQPQLPVVAQPQPSKRPSRPLKEYLAEHPYTYQPPSGPTHLAPDLKRAILANVGTAPKLNKDDIPLKCNPLARPAWMDAPMPAPDASWLNSAPMRSGLLELEDLATPTDADDNDDNAPTAYGRAIMLDKVAKRAQGK